MSLSAPPGITPPPGISVNDNDDGGTNATTSDITATTTTTTDNNNSSNHDNSVVTMVKKKRKWARRQVKKAPDKSALRVEGSTDYNIWYGRYSNEEIGAKGEKAETRCDSQRDSGATRGTLSNKTHVPLCMYFAKGACARGPECHFLHRVPNEHDEKHTPVLYDVFGRERHATDRDDMGGTGNFNRNSRTLYVSDFVMPRRAAGTGGGSGGSVDIRKVQEIFARHFGEWGPIEEISIKPKLGCAFVRFFNRVYAEFAKVAMANQSMDNDEQLNVRWAFDDPNPTAIQRNKQEVEQQVYNAVLASGADLHGKSMYPNMNLPHGYQAAPPVTLDSSGKPVTKRARTESDASMMITHAQQYPNTDHQYTNVAMTPEQQQEYYAQWNAYYANQGHYGAAAYHQTQYTQQPPQQGVVATGPHTREQVEALKHAKKSAKVAQEQAEKVAKFNNFLDTIDKRG